MKKIRQFSGSNDFDGKITHVENSFTNFRYRILMRLGHICLTTCFSVILKLDAPQTASVRNLAIV